MGTALRLLQAAESSTIINGAQENFTTLIGDTKSEWVI